MTVYDEAYMRACGWTKRCIELGWWTVPWCQIMDVTMERAILMQKQREKAEK